MLSIFSQNEEIKHSRETTQDIIEENQHCINYVNIVLTKFSTNNGGKF